MHLVQLLLPLRDAAGAPFPSAHYREVAERLFVDEGNVKRYETRLVFDTVKIGLTLPTRQSPRRRKRSRER